MMKGVQQENAHDYTGAVTNYAKAIETGTRTKTLKLPNSTFNWRVISIS